MSEPTIYGNPPVVDLSELKKVLDNLSALVKKDENEWKLTVWREMDCYILEGKIDDITRRWAIEDDEGDELHSHEALLYEVMSYFGFGGSKHDAERLRVMRKKRND